MRETGNELDPKEWHATLTQRQNQIQIENENQNVYEEPKSVHLIDCRNLYESEIGRFEGATRLPITKHIDSFPELDSILEGKQEDKVMLVRNEY